MAKNRTVPTIGALAAALFLTAAGVKASSVDVPMDINPGSCPNLFSPDAEGDRFLRVAILGTDVFDVNTVDIYSLVIFRADEADDPEKGKVAPLQSPLVPTTDGRITINTATMREHPGAVSVKRGPKVRDLATPFIGPFCDCHGLGADGHDDLVLRFSGATLVNELNLASFPNGEAVDLRVSGELLDGTPFVAGDCIQLVVTKKLKRDVTGPRETRTR